MGSAFDAVRRAGAVAARGPPRGRPALIRARRVTFCSQILPLPPSLYVFPSLRPPPLSFAHSIFLPIPRPLLLSSRPPPPIRAACAAPARAAPPPLLSLLRLLREAPAASTHPSTRSGAGPVPGAMGAPPILVTGIPRAAPSCCCKRIHTLGPVRCRLSFWKAAGASQFCLPKSQTILQPYRHLGVAVKRLQPARPEHSCA